MNVTLGYKSKVIILIIFSISLILLLLHIKTPKADIPYNVKKWKLHDESIITYYEKWDGHSSFTANLHQHITIYRQGSGKSYVIGIGGSLNNLQLFRSKDNNIIWLKGTESRFKEPYIIAAINLTSNVFIDKYKFLWKKEDLNKNEITLMETVKSEQGELVQSAQ